MEQKKKDFDPLFRDEHGIEVTLRNGEICIGKKISEEKAMGKQTKTKAS